MKIVFVANYLPDTNYTRDLSTEFVKIIGKKDELFLCGRKKESVDDGVRPNVDQVWSRGVFFFVPIILYIFKKRPDLIHFQHEFKMYGGVFSAIFFPWLILFLKIFSFKIVITSHGIVSGTQLDKNFLESFGLKNTFLNKLLIIFFLNYVYTLLSLFSDAVTVHASLLRQILIKQYRCNPKKIIVISHGIRSVRDLTIPSAPTIYKRFPLMKNKKIILVFGYFSPRKGFEYLINSFSNLLKSDPEMKNFVMIIAGDVSKEFLSYKNKIEKLIIRNKISRNILITGFVNAVEIDELYRIAEISVIPAVFSFNTSGALAMTLAYKKVLLVSDVKPISEEVSENGFGLLFDIKSPESFGVQVKELISNKKLFKNLKSSVAEKSVRRYWINIAKEHYSLYKKIIKV